MTAVAAADFFATFFAAAFFTAVFLTAAFFAAVLVSAFLATRLVAGGVSWSVSLLIRNRLESWGAGRGCEWNHSAIRGAGWEVTILGVSRLGLPEKASKARQGRWASTQVMVRKPGGKHHSVVPTAESCVNEERLAIQIFRRVLAVVGGGRGDLP